METPYSRAFDAIWAGHAVCEVEPLIQALPSQDRQALLCTVCAIQDEIARNCQQHGQEVSTLLTLYCPLNIDGVATCLIRNKGEVIS